MDVIELRADSGGGGDGMANKSNPIFRVWTEPNRYGEGYLAFWIAPGLEPAMLRNTDKSPRIFPDAEIGELAAFRRMVEALNGPRIKANKQQGKPERHARLTGPELAEAIRAAGITPTFFAYLYATSQKRVIDWLDSVEDVPHPVRVLLALFRFDERNIDLAEKITDAVTESRKPKRVETG